MLEGALVCMAGKKMCPDGSPGMAGLRALIAETEQDRLLSFPASSHACDQGGAGHCSPGSLLLLTVTMTAAESAHTL